jgi:peptide/nickel transport system substrate-binding protein
MDRVDGHGPRSHRLARRRLLAAGGASIGAAAFAACRGSAPKSTKVGNSPGGAPHRGGTLHWNQTTVPPSLDPFRTTSIGTQQLASLVYSRLFKYQAGKGIDPTAYTPAPELAAGYEAPDPATWTFKLRSDVKWHNVAPTNGRALSAADVVYSYQRFSGLPTNSAKNDLDMVDTVTAPDAQTVQFKLKYPYAPFLSLVASPRDLWIMPHELDDVGADKGGDAQQHMVGTGPFVFKSYAQAQSVEFARNPDYFVKGSDGQSLPYFDAFVCTLLTDSNAILSQLNAGHIDILTGNSSLSLAQIQAAKQQNPKLQETVLPANVYTNMMFQPTTYTADQPPFNDVRVRRAISLAIDRDALSKQLFGGQGGWDNVAIPAGFTYWWLDPNGKDIGAGGSWYKHDPAQAKQLLAAAGHGQGLNVTFHFTTAYGAVYQQLIDALAGMLQEVGITPKMVSDNYQAVWIPDVYSGHFEGLFATYIAFYDPDIYYQQALTPQGSFGSSKVNDPQVNQLLAQEKRELDRAKRRDLVWQIQRRASDQMFQIPLVSAPGRSLVQPTVHDFYSNATSYGLGSEVYANMWKDA